MSKQLLIYKRAIPVSSDSHRDWAIKMGDNYKFASDVNSVPLLAAEFLTAAQDYAIVFAGDGDNVVPSVILGIRDNENSNVGADGSWTGGYVPAFLRRYPFVFSRSEDEKDFVLCIDEEFDGFNQDGKGERLFDTDGERTTFLQSKLTFVSEYQTQFERTSAFCKRLQEHDLLEEAQAQFNLADGQTASLSGFFKINREKLKALPADTLVQMVRSDELELCYAHLSSLGNLAPMAQKIAAPDGQSKMEAEEAEAGED
ncbi:SapC family protein [Candidatus Halocynthiibacter alkanivorans]|uniref:SapC family protein n=1 Tax=Candidatus Halocynthiibacter alkanivorans TaxID=2267619 RepID=UPI000DF4708A|nr:SapC family protein [Candidatus Halocynthiibacter alkanivorans]